MTIVVNFWVIGGEFGSMNFHKRSFVRNPPQARALLDRGRTAPRSGRLR